MRGGCAVVCVGELCGELVDEMECVDGWVDVEPELLERELWGGAIGMLELGEEGLVVLSNVHT